MSDPVITTARHELTAVEHGIRFNICGHLTCTIPDKLFMH